MDLYRPANPRSRGAGHYRRPGTSASYCGRTVEAKPSAPMYLNGVCQLCEKGEKRDRIAAEQTVASVAINGPSLAERAHVRYCLVGTGRRVHYSTGNDDTMCGREITEYTDGLDERHDMLCAPCINAAEKRAYARALAAASPLAAAAVGYAATVEAVDAEREQANAARLDRVEADAAASFAATTNAVDAVEHAEQTGAAIETVEDAEALYAARLVTEAEATDGTWRGKWIGEQPTAPEPIIVRVGFAPATLDRIHEQAAADRETYRAETDDRIAAEYRTYGASAPAAVQARIAARTATQVPDRRVIEGVIVSHNGTTPGTAPKHSTDPDARNALAALSPLRLAEVTDHTDIAAQPGEPDHAPAAWGFLIEPRGHGRIALYWVEAGHYVRPDGEPFATELEIGADKLRKAGWTIEPNTRRCVMAWRPE
ncbi:hypothetical protein ACFY8P_35350 [Streptomyces sp. NPDC012693]|uniref:hypothetical protein n=1 Tax=Streptomyces sp. NPDC012693 TaxID=3364844 RepID=UPI00367747F8